MTDLAWVGIGLIGFAIIGASIVASAKIKAKSVADRDRIEARFEKRYQDKSHECDGWRMAYEGERIKNVQLQSTINIQNMVYGKVKVSNMKGAKA